MQHTSTFKHQLRFVCALLIMAACFADASAQATRRAPSSARTSNATRPARQAVRARQAKAFYTNPALAGDYPDPSVIRVGQDYWATATSSEWAPEFPLLHSRDLVNWRIVGAVFQKRPAWSNGNYWAPEISIDRGRYYVYYTGHKIGGSLCVAVASAARPAGPYTDHGPLICQDAGSIDAFPIRDENGKRYLVWKEDGNSRKEPTPIWAQPLTEDGTKLIGEKKELIRNDAAWEAQLVEGPFIMRHGDYFYMFYSGNACCGRECNYAMGVARARNLLGPWEKNPANPILKGNDEWKCPGHGSIVTNTRGRDYLMYHAYHPKDSVYVGRQALLDEVVWNGDDFPTINNNQGPSGRAVAPLRVGERNSEYVFFDDFTTPALRPGWQFPQANRPVTRIDTTRGGRLSLATGTDAKPSDMLGAVLGWWTMTGDYVATTALDVASVKRDEAAGLAAYGDAENALGVMLRGDKLMLYRREKNKDQILTMVESPSMMRGSGVLYLRMTATNGNRFRFASSRDGRTYTDIGGEVDGSYLPPWDRGVRVALTVGGGRDAAAMFESLRIAPTGAIEQQASR